MPFHPEYLSPMQYSQNQAGFSFLKFLLPILFTAAGVMIFQYLMDSKASHPVPAPKEKTWSVQVQVLQAGRYSPEIEIQGKVEAPQRYRAAAPGAGWVEQVTVREGDQVQAGKLLVKLDPRDFTTALTQAEAELADIEAQLVESDIRHAQNQAALLQEKKILALSQKSVARSSKLKKQSLSTDSAVEDLQQKLMRQQLLVNQRELEVKSYDSKKLQLQARKKRIQAQLEQAQRALQRSVVVAPYDGIISTVSAAEGGRVNAGSELVSMYSPLELEIRALIPDRFQSELANALDQQVPLLATDRQSGAQYELVRLAGEARPGGVDGFLHASQPQATRISPGSILTLMLQRPAGDSLYPVPPSAIYDNARVYLLQDGRLLAAAVEIIGKAYRDGKSLRLVRSEQIKDGDELVLTRLPNASTGLKVEAFKTAEDTTQNNVSTAGMN